LQFSSQKLYQCFFDCQAQAGEEAEEVPAEEEAKEVPVEFRCPITMDVMYDPVSFHSERIP